MFAGDGFLLFAEVALGGRFHFGGCRRAVQLFPKAIIAGFAVGRKSFYIQAGQQLARWPFAAQSTQRLGPVHKVQPFRRAAPVPHPQGAALCFLGGQPGVWIVCWESGPFQWAIPASMEIGSATGKLVEPYYSFDLTFYPSED